MYPELPQDMGEIWPHWVRSVWPQKMGSARLAVLWPRLAKVTIDKVKNVFWLKVIFFKTSIQINFIFVVSNGQSDIAAFCRIFRAFWQINSTASWPTVGGGYPCPNLFILFFPPCCPFYFDINIMVFDTFRSFLTVKNAEITFSDQAKNTGQFLPGA